MQRLEFYKFNTQRPDLVTNPVARQWHLGPSPLTFGETMEDMKSYA